MMIKTLKSPLTAKDFRTKNLPINPAKRGIPKSESIAISIMALKNGEFNSFKVSMSKLLCSLFIFVSAKKMMNLATE